MTLLMALAPIHIIHGIQIMSLVCILAWLWGAATSVLTSTDMPYLRLMNLYKKTSQADNPKSDMAARMTVLSMLVFILRGWAQLGVCVCATCPPSVIFCPLAHASEFHM